MLLLTPYVKDRKNYTPEIWRIFTQFFRVNISCIGRNQTFRYIFYNIYFFTSQPDLFYSLYNYLMASSDSVQGRSGRQWRAKLGRFCLHALYVHDTDKILRPSTGETCSGSNASFGTGMLSRSHPEFVRWPLLQSYVAGATGNNWNRYPILFPIQTLNDLHWHVVAGQFKCNVPASPFHTPPTGKRTLPKSGPRSNTPRPASTNPEMLPWCPNFVPCVLEPLLASIRTSR